MFTGIVQAIGRISNVDRQQQDVVLTIAAPETTLSDVELGDSIAVNGVCLTVVSLEDTNFTVHVSEETLRCTQGLDVPGEVNLEKALRLADRLGGHLVSGHVDGIGTVTKFDSIGECTLLEIRSPHAISKYIAIKGSITVNGVSLTVNSVSGDTFTINLIPHTLAVTTLKNLKTASSVNLEVDLIARYIDRMQQWSTE